MPKLKPTKLPKLTEDQKTFLRVCRKHKSHLKGLDFDTQRTFILQEWRKATHKKTWPKKIYSDLYDLWYVDYDFQVRPHVLVVEVNKLALQFRTEISALADDIEEIIEETQDGEGCWDYCWFSLTIGWALANGISLKKAADFAKYIRHIQYY